MAKGRVTDRVLADRSGSILVQFCRDEAGAVAVSKSRIIGWQVVMTSSLDGARDADVDVVGPITCEGEPRGVWCIAQPVLSESGPPWVYIFPHDVACETEWAAIEHAASELPGRERIAAVTAAG